MTMLINFSRFSSELEVGGNGRRLALDGRHGEVGGSVKPLEGLFGGVEVTGVLSSAERRRA